MDNDLHNNLFTQKDCTNLSNSSIEEEQQEKKIKNNVSNINTNIVNNKPVEYNIQAEYLIQQKVRK